MTQLLKNLSELTAQSIAEFRKAVQQPLPMEKLNPLNKAITQATGLVWFDLQAPAKNLFPVLTPLRNKIPRVSGGGGTATNWKQVTAINAGGLRGFVPEGRRNGVIAITAAPKSANYKTLGLEDNVSFEAELAAVNFEDIRATTAQRLLWATMIEEEISDLGANISIALGTPTAPTVTVVDGGGSIADGTYNVIVVALTLHGYMASSVANGVVGLVSVTPPAGAAFTYGGGSSQKSSATSTGAITNGNDSAIRASTPVVNGAVAYAWYVGTAGNERLQAITTLNSVQLTSLLTTTQLASAITADNSQNAYAYDGILYQAYTPGSNAYIKVMATGTPGTGTPLTSDNAGGIVEIDEMLESMWANHKLGPTTLYTHAQESKNITKKLASSGIYEVQLNQEAGPRPKALDRVREYPNKFTMQGGPVVAIEIHPNLPAGTLLAVTEQLPYPMTNVPNVFEKRLRRDYYQMEWPLTQRLYESGVYFDGVLAHYFPPSIGIITNIGNG